jgi:flagellar hook-associated protein 1 FlgK
MASIFNALNIGYTGLNAAQVGINTTGHNISNAEVDGYTRQRVIASAATPLQTSPGNVGNGVEIQTIKRVFDNFVFDRYSDTYAQKEYSDYEKSTLEELSTYYPEIDAVGIKADLQEYYNMWQTFSDNPDNDAIKLSLSKQTEVLSDHIKYTYNQVESMQSKLNDQLSVNINEVNTLAKELASLNKSIDTAEAGTAYSANDLRDRRNVIERDLSRLIGAETTVGQLESNIQIDSSSNTKTGSYTVSVNGFNLVDGDSYHPIHISSDQNSKGFNEISFEREDGVLIPMEENINSGKIGAILELRGGAIDNTTGVPKDGVLQNNLAELNAFANSLVETTNNLYAQSPTTRMDSNVVSLDESYALMSSDLNINAGSFSIVVYDIDGNVAASRDIKIDVSTSIAGTSSNSIKHQIEENKDDNSDGNANNDINDFINFGFDPDSTGTRKLTFDLDALSKSQGYTFSISDNLTNSNFSSGTNFAGALGMSRFFDGDDAKSIDLNFELKENPTAIKGGKTPVAGDNSTALDMVQHQYESYNIKIGDISYDSTMYGMFDVIATGVGTATNSAIIRNETINTQFNAVEMEYFSTSKVSIDEEMTNLIKYQTSYGAAAKVITTIDQMMNTLLGIKS